MVSKSLKILTEVIKTFLIFFFFLGIINWYTTGTISVYLSLKFALWMTLSIILPIIVLFFIVFPELNKDSSRERLAAFRESNMAAKIISALTFLVGLSFIVLWWMMKIPGFGLSFWTAVVISLGIGLLSGTVSALLVWLIIRRKSPPFQKWTSAGFE